MLMKIVGVLKTVETEPVITTRCMSVIRVDIGTAVTADNNIYSSPVVVGVALGATGNRYQHGEKPEESLGPNSGEPGKTTPAVNHTGFSINQPATNEWKT